MMYGMMGDHTALGEPKNDSTHGLYIVTFQKSNALIWRHTISLHTYISQRDIGIMARDHNFLEPKVDAPESNAFSSNTACFQTKIGMGDEGHFCVMFYQSISNRTSF